jgi:hypothetical protein
MQSKGINRRQLFSQPIDKVAIGLMVILSMAIAVLLLLGDRTKPEVREFSWQDRQVEAADTAFVLTFNRPMDQDSVIANLNITPELPGKVSWAGRRMAYTLDTPAVYGNEYTIELKDAYDRFADEVGNHVPIEPFTAKFSTPAPAFAYIGAGAEDAGRLVLYDQQKQGRLLLTPENLSVTDFRIYSDRQKILFSAAERLADGSLDILEQKIYTVTTGLGANAKPAGELALVLDSQEYQNFKFDLAANGKIIVVQRLDKQNPGRYGLWVIKDGESPKPLNNEPGGDFVITPDSDAVAIAQGEGVAILPLEPEAEPLDFLPRFGTVLSFSRDGTQALTIKFNTDYTRSLFLVTNQGVQQELFRTEGSILGAQFSPNKQIVYCLLTDLYQAENLYREVPYLAAIDLQTNQLTRLLDLPEQQDLRINLAPDGTAIAFDVVLVDPNQVNQINRDYEQTGGEVDITAAIEQTPPQIKLLSLPGANIENPGLVSLNLFGSQPRWLP